MQYKILIVDDESDICDSVKFFLENQGFIADTAVSVADAKILDLSQYDLFILDIMMPGTNGFDFARQIKKSKDICSKPILFCTAKNSVNDKVTGLDLGADDYMTKPFHMAELLARINAVLRRSITPQRQSILEYESLKMDTINQRVYVDEIDVNLTKKEYEILSLLLSNIGQIYSREQILEKVWTDDVFVVKKSVDVTITRLRKKIGKYAGNIVSYIGFGYSFKKK